MKASRYTFFVMAVMAALCVLPGRSPAMDDDKAAEASAAAGGGGAEAAAEAGVPEPSYGGLSLGTIQPPTQEEEEALEELAEDIEIYNRNAENFRETIKNIIKREYELRKGQIDKEFSRQIDEEERLEEEARKSAIEYFEAFLEKYPANDKYTPDAMFRLSELYYEQAYVDHLYAYDEYREEYDRWGQGLVSQEPVEPTRDYSKTIAIYEQLIERWPDYRNIDGVYYLLGFCLYEMGRFDESNITWLSFVCANEHSYEDVVREREGVPEVEEGEESEHPAGSRPEVSTEGEVEGSAKLVMGSEPVDTYRNCEPLKEKSRFYTETWLRIGEYHFDFDYSKMGLSNAISAYKKARQNEESSFYDLALYKLAWSYWRNGNYPEAIRNFIEVVEYSDRKAEETGKSGSQLRPEAVQYIALSLWEPDWDGDGAPDNVSGFDRLRNTEIVPQDRPWTSEVYAWLGDVYMDDNANMKAIQVFEETLARWPNAAEAPEIVTKIARAYQREKMEQEVIETRARLAEYGKDSKWWEENMDKPELQEKALIAAEEALKQTALHHHEVAQNLKTVARSKTDPGEQQELYMRAIEEYNLAATAYKKYLESYPNSPDAYEINFFLGETYFWSRQYEESVPVYEKVRDSQMDNKYQEDAAFMVVSAIEELRDQQIKSGALNVRGEPPEPSTGPDGKPVVSPEPMPSILTRYIEAMDTYNKLFPRDRKNGPVFVYNAAELYYNYGHWDEARTRFEKIYDEYCKKDMISVYSWQNMTAMAGKLDHVDEAETLANLQKEKQCGVGIVEMGEGEGEEKELLTKVDQTIKDIIGTAEVRKAMDMFKEAEKTGDVALYEKAAESLEKVVTKNPEHQDADKMLWNAAISYEKSNKFTSALRVSRRIVDEYPESDFMGEALFKLAENSFNAFEYDNALTNYKVLADEKRFKGSEHEKPAVQNVALILENQQKYKEAARYWERFSHMAENKKEAMAAQWNAARCYEKGKMWSSAIKEMNNFKSRFAGQPEAADELVEASWTIAEAYKSMGKKRDYEKELTEVIVTYNSAKSNIEAGSIAIDHAAEAKFILIEDGLGRIEKFKLNTNNEKKVAQDLENLKKMRDELIDQYVQVVNMASPEWSVAAQFRVGYLYETHAKILLDAPIPKSVIKLGPEAEEMYREKIMSLVMPLEDQSQAEYAKALEISSAAGVFSNWTELTLERLNAYNPDEYPIYKKGKTASIEESFGTAGFDTE